jgi:hypothetical protein
VVTLCYCGVLMPKMWESTLAIFAAKSIVYLQCGQYTAAMLYALVNEQSAGLYWIIHCCIHACIHRSFKARSVVTCI